MKFHNNPYNKIKNNKIISKFRKLQKNKKSSRALYFKMKFFKNKQKLINKNKKFKLKQKMHINYL